MKRHHIVAVFVLIFGGLFAYIQFHHGDTDDAIQKGIICTLLGVVVFFYEKLKILAQTCGNHGALSFLMVNGGSCGAHGGYSGSNFLMYHGDRRRSLSLLSGHTIL